MLKALIKVSGQQPKGWKPIQKEGRALADIEEYWGQRRTKSDVRIHHRVDNSVREANKVGVIHLNFH